jgi:hypothetical protein
MKEMAAVLFASFLLIGATGVAVSQFDDREIFVPPPDAVAEGFAREIVTKRWARARPYLTRDASDKELAALHKAWEERVGEPTTIEAETISRDRDRALVNVRLQSAKGSEAVAFGLVFEEEWKVELPAGR